MDARATNGQAAEPAPVAGSSGEDPRGPERRAGLSRLPRVPFELFLAVLVGAILLGVVTVMNQTTRNDAEAGRRRAEATLATAESSATEMATTNADLAAANADLVQANADLESLNSALERDLEAERDSLADLQAEVDELRAVPEFDTTPLDDEIAALEDQVAELEQTNAELTEAAENADDDGGAVDAPAFAQFVGDVLAADEGFRATADEARCLGQAVIDDLGLEAVGAGLIAAEPSDEVDALQASFASAAPSCGIEFVDESEG